MLRLRLRIPKGAWRIRMLAKLPLEVVLLLVALVLLAFMTFHTPWILGIAIPLWGFAKYQTKQDPKFLQAWNGHLSFGSYYHG